MRKRQRTYARSRSRSTTKKAKTTTYKNILAKPMSRRPLGNYLFATVSYIESRSMDPGLSTTAVNVYRLSSINDPYFTGAGGQPVAHDQLGQIFERYQVYKVEYHVEFINDDVTNAQRVGVFINDKSDVPSAVPDGYLENGMSEWTLLAPSGSQSKAVFKGCVNLPEVHGLTHKQYMANDDYGAAFSSNPIEEAYMHVHVDGLGVNTGTVKMALRLMYHVKCMGSIITGPS